MPTDIAVEKLDDFRWLIPKTGKMRTQGLVYTDETMLATIGFEEITSLAFGAPSAIRNRRF